tara:strand:+ start:284 stop:616 length:333 start_codon:yes stop_codon:yes gene_type:complete
MSQQLFKLDPSKNILIEFLETNSEKKDKYYLFDKCSFKKAKLNLTIGPFIENIKEYYHESKQIYVNRPLSYKMIITILRQICKYHHIPFFSKINYSHSKYNICYKIYYDV